ncbi:tetratricopeptide (TPR) repeat protein [Catenulispora sp. GP43]|uniref:tetratricopeptide repeat protein n=1 Tax=Catenulispora sp. GP43 TaxID=3156263 RepID=UPI0035199D70
MDTYGRDTNGTHDEHDEQHTHTHTNACDTGCCERLEAEGEVAVARLILDGGDIGHAADHVAGAIGTDPSLPEAHEALAELVARVGGPVAALELFPATSRYTGELACRAALLAAIGRLDEAVMLLAGVMAAAPARPWAAVAWMADPELPSRLSAESLTQAVLRLCQGLGDPVSEEERAALVHFAEVVRAVMVRGEDPQLAAVASGLARRLGDTRLAVEWGEVAVRSGAGAMGAIMLGNALRRAGRVDETIALWTRTVEQDPGQSYLVVDLAELLAFTGRRPEGLALLEKLVAAEPEHEKAAPALLGMRFEADGDTMHLLELTDYYRAHPDHDYAGYLLGHHVQRFPWLGRVTGGTEACINVLRQLVEQDNLTVSGEMSLSIIEPPSAINTLRLVIPGLQVAFLETGDPDPRLPGAEVGVRVWRYEGCDAVPAVEPPSARARALVRDLATPNWPGPTALYDHAVALAGVPVTELLGVLAYPPAPQDAPWQGGSAMEAPDYWVRSVQTIACMGIAHHRADQPWAESERRRILVELLNGPEDWVCEAAGMALVAVGWAFPEAREDVLEWVLNRVGQLMQVAEKRAVTVLGSMCHLVLACPWLEPKGRAFIADVVERLESED